MTLRRTLTQALAVLALGQVRARADVSLHGIFTDHAVLQAGRPVPIWTRAKRHWVCTCKLARHATCWPACSTGPSPRVPT